MASTRRHLLVLSLLTFSLIGMSVMKPLQWTKAKVGLPLQLWAADPTTVQSVSLQADLLALHLLQA